MFVNCSQNGQLGLYQNQCTFQKIHSLSTGGAHSRLLVHIASPTSPPLCWYTTHSSVPRTATVEMPFLWHCSTNGKLRILVKAQSAPQAPGHCHQLGLAYTLGHCGISAASRHKLASTGRHHSLLTATDTTALY